MAATKCRLRKLERISVLDNEASKLRVENELLSKTTENLKQKACNIDDRWCALWGLIFKPLFFLLRYEYYFVLPTGIRAKTRASLAHKQWLQSMATG